MAELRESPAHSRKCPGEDPQVQPVIHGIWPVWHTRLGGDGDETR